MARKAKVPKEKMQSKELVNLGNEDITDTYSEVIETTTWAEFTEKSSAEEFRDLVNLVGYSKSIEKWKFMLESEEKLKIFYYRVLSEDQNDVNVLYCVLAFIKNIKLTPLRTLLSGLFSITSWQNLRHINDLLKSHEKSYLLDLYEEEIKREKTKGVPDNIKEIQSKWIYQLSSKFVSEDFSNESFKVCSDILVEILSFLPTRRYSNFLLKQLNIDTALSLRKSANAHVVELFQYLMNYPIDDFEATMLTVESLSKSYGRKLKLFESLVFDKFGITNLTIQLEKESFLKRIQELDDSKLESFCEELYLDTSILSTNSSPKTYIPLLLWNYIQDYSNISEITDSFLPESIASIPTNINYKTMGYISVDDFLWKEYHHLKLKFQREAIKLVSNTSDRLKVSKADHDDSSFKATQSSKYAARISKVASVKEDFSYISLSSPGYQSKFRKIEVHVDFNSINGSKIEWDSLKSGDVVFLLFITDVGIKTFLPSIIFEASSKNAKERKFTISIEKKYHQTKELTSLNFIIRCNEDAGHLAKSICNLYKLANEKSKSLHNINASFVDYILNIGSSQPISLYDENNTSNVTLKIGDQSYLIELKGEESLNKKFKTTNGSVGKYNEIKGTKFRDFRSSNGVYEPSNVISSIISAVLNSISIVNGPITSNRSKYTCDVVNSLVQTFPKESILIITKTSYSKSKIIDQVSQFLPEITDIYDPKTFSRSNILESSFSLLDSLIKSLGLDEAYANDVKSMQFLFDNKVQVLWKKYLDAIKQSFEVSTIKNKYPFSKYHELDIKDDLEVNEAMFQVVLKYNSIVKIFRDIEKFSESSKVYQFPLSIMTFEEFNRSIEINESLAGFDTLIVEDTEDLSEMDLIQISTMNSQSTKRVILSGDSNVDATGLFTKFSKQILPEYKIDITDPEERVNKQIYDMYQGKINEEMYLSEVSKYGNPGFLSAVQFIDVATKGEIEIQEHEFQNLEEAEYSVALYMYMSLLGYPGSSISIITNYKAQKILIDEILLRRCKNSKLFDELPKVQFLSDASYEINDYSILSLVTTDKELSIWTEEDEFKLRRVLANSIKGCYILGKVDSILKLEEEMKKNKTRSILRLLTVVPKSQYIEKTQNDDWKQMFKSHLVGKEMYTDDFQRTSSGEGNEVAKSRPFNSSPYDMQSLEHFGSYVAQMTSTKLQQLKKVA